MGSVLDNVFYLLHEAEIELDDRFIDMYEGKLKTLRHGLIAGAAGATAGVAASKAANMAGIPTNSDIIGKGAEAVKGLKKAYDSDSVAKSVSPNANPDMVGGLTKTAFNDKESAMSKVSDFGSELANSPISHMAGIGALAAIGGAALFKYHNSIMRGKYLVNHYGKLAASAKDPASKAKYTEKLNWAKNKLATAQAKARTEHKGFIEKSQLMKSQIAQLQKAGRKDEAAKLSAKLAKRQSFLSKIGASI